MSYKMTDEVARRSLWCTSYEADYVVNEVWIMG